MSLGRTAVVLSAALTVASLAAGCGARYVWAKRRLEVESCESASSVGSAERRCTPAPPHRTSPCATRTEG